MTDLYEGDRVDVTVGPVAHGGHCVARIGGEHGRVVFVRHALPGEVVTAEITEVHKGYLRADAVAVGSPSADRVTAPCVYAHPGGCGGCDLQHVDPAAQLGWKRAVVEEQLARIGGFAPAEIEALRVRVEALPGGSLGWRSRVRYAVDGAGRAGLLKHRSHEVVPVAKCLIAHPAIQELPVTSRHWETEAAVETVATTGGDALILPSAGAVTEKAVGRTWDLPAGAFWQVHPAAADTLAAAVLDLLRPAPGETAWDLYGGAGLFAAAVAGRTRARVTLVESAPDGVAAARRNLADLSGVEVVAAKVEAALRRRRVTGPVDLVVLDPPRTGAGPEVVKGVAAAGPRAVAYVACDPAALARDLKTFRAQGYEVAELRAYDCFPMTHHVECVALVQRSA